MRDESGQCLYCFVVMKGGLIIGCKGGVCVKGGGGPVLVIAIVRKQEVIGDLNPLVTFLVCTVISPTTVAFTITTTK